MNWQGIHSIAATCKLARWKRGASLLFVISWLATSAPTHADMQLRTYKEGIYLITEGTLDANDWFDSAKTVILDYAHYNNWILKGLDGKDAKSAKYWENFVSFDYVAPRLVSLVYNMNLDWPFGSKGNIFNFQIIEKNAIDTQISFVLKNPSIIVEEAYLFLFAETSRSHTASASNQRLRFRLTLHLAGVVEAFMDVPSYGNHMNEVMGQLASNLKEQALLLAQQ